jgi:hypothetical protein
MKIALPLSALLLFIVSDCQAYEYRGQIAVTTDGSGKVKSFTVSKTNGNPHVDARALRFARSTFLMRVPNPEPNERYIYPVRGSKEITSNMGSVRVDSWKSLASR